MYESQIQIPTFSSKLMLIYVTVWDLNLLGKLNHCTGDHAIWLHDFCTSYNLTGHENKGDPLCWNGICTWYWLQYQPGEKLVMECCGVYLIFLPVKCFTTLGCVPHTSEWTSSVCTLLSKSPGRSSKSLGPWKHNIRQLQRRFPLCNCRRILQWQVYFTSKLNFSLSTFPLLLSSLKRKGKAPKVILNSTYFG